MIRFFALIFIISFSSYAEDIFLLQGQQKALKTSDFTKVNKSYVLEIEKLTMKHKSALIIPSELHGQRVIINVLNYRGKGRNIITQSFGKKASFDLNSYLYPDYRSHPRAKNGVPGRQGPGQPSRHGQRNGENGKSSSELTINLNINAVQDLNIIMLSQSGGNGGKGNYDGGKGGTPGYPGKINSITINWFSNYNLLHDHNAIPNGVNVIPVPGISGVPGEKGAQGTRARHGDFLTPSKEGFLGRIESINFSKLRDPVE